MKVLLRERKRHTARRVAIVISCYSEGGGVPQQKKIFSSLNMYRAKSGVKKFSLDWGRGGGEALDKNFFFPVWTCIKPNLVSKNFPFTRGGGPSTKIFFFQSEHVSSQIWCQKIFPLLGGGVPPQKIFFSSLNMYQAKSGVKKFSLY